ncbi:hypothetical protein NH8B_2077 [Pseudogulbenkiania sp. NH8B]|uniref:hypothetical protein n=1 Tax=Pseudogulbenkiania sp. (strain NH8B) TaxID=748280 RepID=UPI0002279B3A|nr:hypothetical protein [Pseudogulbenkiania sp. NH8B]BAK76463.1 hypothetical protein NH8B_1646 [Pseudogulbenkiania sp. NH8B]BAK76892.1 hypothetical protein NH8B_2077 [Pseudogulbenkiania sp. NH8B]
MIDRKRPKRQPANMEMVGGKGSRQRTWEAVRKLRDDFTAYQVARVAKADDETVLTYLRSLDKGGFITCLTPADAPLATVKRYSLTRDNGIEAPRLTKDGKVVKQGLGTEAMWRVMRIIGDFTCRELAAHASTSEVKVSEDSANSYIRALKLAGYLVVTAEAKTRGIGEGRTLARYRLAPGRYTGPRPPMIQRTKNVYDPNLGKVVWQQEIDHDDL